MTAQTITTTAVGTVSVSRAALLEALEVAVRAIGKRARPPLACVKLDATHALHVTAFDYEIAVSTEIRLAGPPSEHLSAAVEARLLRDVIKAMPVGGTVTLDFTPGRVTVRCEQIVSPLITGELDSFPALPAMPKAQYALRGEDLTYIQKRVGLAAGDDDTLPVLTAVRFEPGENGLDLFATDRYRLAAGHLGHVACRGAAPMLLRRRTVDLVARALAGEAMVTVRYDDPAPSSSHYEMMSEWVAFTTSGITVMARTTDGTFPKVRSLLPDQHHRTFTVDCKALTTVLKAAAGLCQRTEPVRLTFVGTQVTVAAGDSDTGYTAPVPLQSWTGDDAEFLIAFQPAYLLDAIKGCAGPTIQIAMTTAAKPALVTNPADGSYRYLVMPVRLNG